MLFLQDLKTKAQWCYGDVRVPTLLKTCLTDGSLAMLLYRLMQWSRRWKLEPLAMVFNKLNAVCCQCIIGRGAEFGPGFVLIHSQGVVINGEVRGGSNIFLEHQVTIGAEKGHSPVLEDNVFIGAGAKVIGSLRVGHDSKIGANAVVVHDVPPGSTVGGIPARVLKVRPRTSDVEERLLSTTMALKSVTCSTQRDPDSDDQVRHSPNVSTAKLSCSSTDARPM